MSTAEKVARNPQDLAPLIVERANAGDIEGLLALYEPDAVLALDAARLAVGIDEIRTFFASRMAAGNHFSVGTQRPALVNGDLALTSTRLPNGTVTAEVARRQADGTWRWILDQPAISS